MSNNIILSLHLFYSESSISHLDTPNLYRHVLETTRQLGIPTPARAHVKKVGDGTVWVEHLSVVPSALPKVERAIEIAGNLRPTLGLIAINSSNYCYAEKKASFRPQSYKPSAPSSVPPAYRPSHLSPQVFTTGFSAPAEGAVVLSAGDPQNKFCRVDERNISDPCLRPLPPSSTLQGKRPETSNSEQLFPSLTLPPRPSWVTDPNTHSDKLPPRAPLKGRTTSGIEESGIQPLKRTRELEEGEEDTELAVHKRRRLENTLSHFENSSQGHGRTNRSNDKILSTSSAVPDGRPDQDAYLQSLRKNVSDLEKNLHKKKTELTLLRQELDEERGKRLRAELIVEDIRREMKDPFVVPSLLDAFITLTDISNICIEESHRS